MGKGVPDKNHCIRINLFHEGVFIACPFQYAHSDEKKIADIHFEGTPLRIGIKPLKNDSDVDLFVNFAYQNKWEVNLYVEHSSDEEDLNYVDFRTKVDENVVIKIVTTNDPFLNKLCADSPQFINFVDEPVNANVKTVVEDIENIDPEFNVKHGIVI
ncbi:hypothetical protein Tco_0927962 [Tanacetum coccineum]